MSVRKTTTLVAADPNLTFERLTTLRMTLICPRCNSRNSIVLDIAGKVARKCAGNCGVTHHLRLADGNLSYSWVE